MTKKQAARCSVHKIAFVFMVFFFCLCKGNLFAQTAIFPVYSANKTLTVIKTAYFDIIFPEMSRQTALLLAEKGDSLYEQICFQFNTQPGMRLPVVVTPDNAVLNAYYTPVPYNRIVVYDTPPQDGQLAVFSDTLFSVFTHELTHAISLNIKSPVWQSISKVVGDVVSPAYLNMPSSFVEGASVSQESKDTDTLTGEGRLNDAYSMQILAQAKLENRFPDWEDVAGGRDIHPVGVPPYMFGGAFAAWLQQKYGMETYAKLWEESGKIHFFKLFAGIYKKVYGHLPDDDWAEFKDSISVPQVVSLDKNPMQQGIFASLAASSKGIAWINTAASEVRYKKYDSAKVTKLFSADSLDTRLAFSDDGRYLAVSGSIKKAGLYQNNVRFFDLHTKKFLPLTIPDVRDASFARLSDGTEVLAAIHTESQRVFLDCYQLDLSPKTPKEQYKLLARIEAPKNTLWFSPISAHDGTILYIESHQNQRVLVTYDPLAKTSKKFQVLDQQGLPLVIRYLQTVPGETSSCTVSWTAPNQLTRTAYINLADSTMLLQNQDLSGGLHLGVLADAQHFYAVSRFYAKDVISEYDATQLLSMSTSGTLASLEQEANPAVAAVTAVAETTGINRLESRYNPFPYMFKGIFLPGLSLDIMGDLQSVTQQMEGGFSYFSVDPAQRWQLFTRGGYNVQTQRFSAAFDFKNVTHPVRWGVDFVSSFAKNQLPLFSPGFSTSYSHSLANIFNTVTISNRLGYVTNTLQHQVSDIAQITFSGLHSAGLRYYQIEGPTTGLVAFALFQQPFFLYDAYAFAGWNFPGFPFTKIPQRITFNFPGNIKLYSGLTYCGFSGSLVLFAVEIQKALRFVPLHLNRFSIQSGYSGEYSWKNNRYTDSIDSKFFLTFSPYILGIAAISFDSGVNFGYKVQEQSWKVSILGSFRL